jgi:hypothetical protein
MENVCFVGIGPGTLGLHRIANLRPAHALDSRPQRGPVDLAGFHTTK